MLTNSSRAAFVLVVSCASVIFAREWTDSTGRYKVEADLIAYNDTTAVLKRADGRLVAVPIDRLSEADQKYLSSKEAEEAAKSTDGIQRWTLVDGLKVTGRVVGYGRHDVTIQRRRGRIYVNNRVLENLPDVYQKMVPHVVEHFENIEFASDEDFRKWVTRLRGEPRTYTLDGVRLELENGDEYVIPFFFFSAEDREVLQPSWDEWLAAEKEREQRELSEFYLQAQARAYHQDRRVAEQIAMMQLDLLAVNAGLVDLWEVILLPPPGQVGYPIAVIVPARNSLQATTIALENNPGYVVGPVRKVAG